MTDDTPSTPPSAPIRGRGAASRPDGRFEQWQRAAFDDGWTAEEEAALPKTELIVDTAKSVIVEARSPDIPFELSINPYRGCEHVMWNSPLGRRKTQNEIGNLKFSSRE
ncbi:hypothetical protein [Niveibacterium sp.]|uniref:hypothetical protein n=1 Tax=Niveibacterium sp. TaxID=2017444 RepID=UPI0035AF12DE